MLAHASIRDGQGSRWQLAAPTLTVRRDGGRTVITPGGDWVLGVAGALETLVAGVNIGSTGEVSVEMERLGRLDTAGGVILNRILRRVADTGRDITLVHASEAHGILMAEIHDRDVAPVASPRPPGLLQRIVHGLGEVGIGFWVDVRDITAVLGGCVLYFVRWLTHPWRFRIHSCARQIQRIAMNAVPIVGLMSFLIGAIVAQQGAFYFRRYGAELMIVDLTGILTLREIGVLLTAVMVAGRSGSSVTAEIGSMTMREEVDALRVIGLDPIEVLVLPRIIGLVVAMPILTFVSDVAALIGAAVVSVVYVGIPIEIFLHRLADAITVNTLSVGLMKAPFMALIIGLIACVEGLQVKGSAESLGAQTTISVVKSIFMVVVVDGLFAVFFAAADI